MRYVKHFLATMGIAVTAILVSPLTSESEWSTAIYAALIVIFFSLFLFNFFASSRLRFKPYFTSRFNLFAAKSSRSFHTEISKEDILDKLLEVLKENNWTLQEIDRESGEILASTGMTFRSWGENIYLDVSEEEGKNLVEIQSVALFQMYMWGKNEDNLDQFYQKFEESLIV